MVNRKSSVLCATINGVELEYIVQGSGEPVVLIHGSIYSDSYFPLMAQPILANHYRMINYHRRWLCWQHTSRFCCEYSTTGCWLQWTYGNSQYDRAHIVGHSYGGTIALQLTIDAPNKLQTLSLLEPALVGHVQGASELIPQLESSVNSYKKGNMVQAIELFCQLIGHTQECNW